jgi:HAD superfamily hydrolase (TIGR01484 family)
MNFYGKKTLEGYHPQGDYTWGKRYTKQTGAIYDFKTQESSNISRNDIIKILLICDPEKRSLLLEELQPSVQEEAQITCSNPEFIELLYKGQTKGSMLQTWCDSQGISPKDVAAFGDAENDYEMLSLVGHGIAAYNATPGLKKIHPRVSQWTNNQGFITKEIALIQSMETTH